MIFRKATIADIEAIVDIMATASARLGAAGIDQWQRGYPNRTSVEKDVAEGVGMVLSEGDHENEETPNYYSDIKDQTINNSRNER